MPSYAVIGGSRGVGLELVRQLAASPENTVFVTVRNKASSTYLAALVADSAHNNIHVLQADVVDHRAMKVAAEEVAKITGGSLDVLIHNAARMESANIFLGMTDYEDEDKLDAEFLEAFKVNTLGVIHSINAFLALLRSGTTKKVVVISSGAGVTDLVWKVRLANMAAYGTTKAATNMVTTKYAALLEDEGFVVIALSPGMVDVSATYVTPLSETINEDVAKLIVNFRKAVPTYDPKPLTPEESVQIMLQTIASAGPAETGQFLSHYDKAIMES